MAGLFIPTLSHWLLGNPWSGSLGRGSYHVTVRKREEESEDGGKITLQELFVEIWTGPLCYELSQAEDTACFPISPEGLGEMEKWLEENLTRLDRAAAG